jgi:PAS domain S-box-containing protein
MKKTKRRARRSPSDLMSAIDKAHAASTDLQVRALLHELQVHSEEITVQNEQLLRAQSELEQARDRYADLYDFAPIGYLSLDQHGTITEINLAGAALLGRARRFLIGLSLPSLIAGEHRERFRDFVVRSLNTIDHTAPEAEVTIKSSGRTVRLMARPMARHLGPSQLFTAMLDVTEQRRLEVERQQIYEAERKRSAELAREVAVRLAAEERVKALLERLVNVQEQERRRLALNLHDQLGQQLTALRLTMDALKEVKPGSAEGRSRFALIEKIVTQLDRDVDFLAWELRPAALDDVGIEAALQEFIRQWSWTQGVEARFHSSLGDGPRMPPDVESHLYRIVQEALNNAGKHAQAQHVSVLLERRREELALTIEDDGVGFDTEQVRRRKSDMAMGLAGMQERAASIGGQLQCESAPGKGTTLFVRIPMKEQPAVGGG